MVRKDLLSPEPSGLTTEDPFVAKQGRDAFPQLRRAATLAASLVRESTPVFFKLARSGILFQIVSKGALYPTYRITVLGMDEMTLANQWQARELSKIYEQHLNNPRRSTYPAGRRHRRRGI